MFGGLIFVAKSPRYVDIPPPAPWMAGAPLSYVGVFRNAQPATIAKTVDALGSPPCNCTGTKTPPMSRPCAPCCPAGC